VDEKKKATSREKNKGAPAQSSEGPAAFAGKKPSGTKNASLGETSCSSRGEEKVAGCTGTRNLFPQFPNKGPLDCMWGRAVLPAVDCFHGGGLRPLNYPYRRSKREQRMVK